MYMRFLCLSVLFRCSSVKLDFNNLVEYITKKELLIKSKALLTASRLAENYVYMYISCLHKHATEIRMQDFVIS